MEVSRTDYLKIDSDSSKKMLKALWYSKSKELDDAGFKQELCKWRDCIDKCKPELLLVDSSDMNFTMDIPIQEWMVANIFPAYDNAGVRRNAFIVSNDLITALSIEQTIDEDLKAQYITKYFNTEADAINWLLGVRP